MLLESWQWVTQNRQNFLIQTNNFRWNCPLEATQILSVMVLNAQIWKIYGASPWTLPGEFPPVESVLILQISTFVIKLNLYPKNRHCQKCLDKSLLSYAKWEGYKQHNQPQIADSERKKLFSTNSQFSTVQESGSVVLILSLDIQAEIMFLS